MKKNKILYRCYVGGYFLWLFGAVLAPLLCVHISYGFAWTMFAVAVLALAGLITSHVFYNKKREWYFLSSYIAHGVNAGLVLLGFILEMTYLGKGEMGLYAVIISSICLAFYILDYSYLIVGNKAAKKKMLDKQAAIEAELAEREAAKEAAEKQS